MVKLIIMMCIMVFWEYKRVIEKRGISLVWVINGGKC